MSVFFEVAMFGSLPTNKTILSLIALTTLSGASLIDAAHAQSSAKSSSQRLEITRIVRGLSALRLSVSDLSKQVANMKPATSTSPVSAPTTSTPAPTPAAAQAPIGKNTPTDGWVTFDFYPGRIGEAVSYHNATGIGVAFRIRESGKLALEYKLNFPFSERTAEQRSADIFMIQNCINDFNRASKVDGGTFFIQASSDPKLGILCSAPNV